MAVPVIVLSSSVFALQPFIEAQIGQGVSNNANLSRVTSTFKDNDTILNYTHYGASNTLSGKLGIGAMLNKYLGVELSYMQDLKDMNQSIKVQKDSSDFRDWNVTEKNKLSSIDASLLLNIPITRDGQFYLHQNTGVSYNRIQHNISADGIDGYDPTDPSFCSKNPKPIGCVDYHDKTPLSSSGFGFDLGVGFGYHITNNFSLEVNYDNMGTLKGERNIQMYSAGIKYLI